MFNRTMASRPSPTSMHEYVLERSDTAHIRKLYTFRYKVQGKGQFPVDMLRYDSAWVEDGSDFYRGEGSNELRTVTLSAIHHGSWQPCYDRWRSFGWFVTSTATENV